MSKPISPAAETGPRGQALPAYVSNGLIGLRVRENPLHAGLAMVSGFYGEHHERRVEAAVPPPYPLAGDIALDGVWLSEQPGAVANLDQAYDFETAELTSRFRAILGERAAEVEIVTFASRSHPTVVCQETAILVDGPCELTFRARIDNRGVRGRQAGRWLDTPGEPEPACDGVLHWLSEGGLSSCGLALVTEALCQAERGQDPWDEAGPLSTNYRLQARSGRRYRFRQMVSLVPQVMHAQPHWQAMRMVSQARELGFERIRRLNRVSWSELWESRIVLEGAGDRWQGIADAAFFYLNASVHPSSPSSTSIYGLATWHDYHYYYGHVMWDVDAFAVPPLSVMQPAAARALLEFRQRSLPAARNNAKLLGLAGLRFPWEASPHRGDEATPGSATGAFREDHLNLHVARAFAFHADATGDRRFLDEAAWPVLSGVADWAVSRVSPAGSGYEIRRMGGPAETKEAVDNDALTIMAMRWLLERAADVAGALGRTADPDWLRVAAGLRPPLRADGAIASHDDFRIFEEKGATPSPLMGLFPYWIDIEPHTAEATLDLYLSHWRDYAGAPMLAELYGVWAAWRGDRGLALKLMDEGYGLYQAGRFSQTLEYRLDRFPGGVASGPFFANIGGFLTGLLFGFPGLKVGPGDPAGWAVRPVVLPKGWEAIRCERLRVRAGEARLLARQGAARAELRLV